MYRVKHAFNYALSALLSPSPYPSDKAPRLLSRIININWQGNARCAPSPVCWTPAKMKKSDGAVVDTVEAKGLVGPAITHSDAKSRLLAAGRNSASSASSLTTISTTGVLQAVESVTARGSAARNKRKDRGRQCWSQLSVNCKGVGCTEPCCVHGVDVAETMEAGPSENK